MGTPQMSTLTTFNAVQPASPLLTAEVTGTQLLTQYFLGQLAASDSEQSEQVLLSAGTAGRNLVHRHIQELKAEDQQIPRINALGSMRKTFREFFTKEQEHLFSFLEVPITSSDVLSSTQSILRRFGRHDYNANRVKIRDLALDISYNEVILEVDTLLQPASLQTWTTQTRQLLDCWRQTIQLLTGAEKRLDTHLKIFQDTHKKATAALALPINDQYETLLHATEGYLKQVFQDSPIEDCYLEYIRYLKKIIVLSDAVNMLRMFVNMPTEPLCSVCLVEPVSLTSIPCGHTFCTPCGQRQLITCYICRTPVKDRQRIFFS